MGVQRHIICEGVCRIHMGYASSFSPAAYGCLSCVEIFERERALSVVNIYVCLHVPNM